MEIKSSWKERLTAIFLINIATLGWAGNMVLGRWMRNDIGPFTLTALRYSIASVPFVLILSLLPVKEQSPGRDILALLAMACTGIVLFPVLLYCGLHFTQASNATIINGLGPVVTGILASLLIQEKLSKRGITGTLLGFFGITFFITRGSLKVFLMLSFNRGDLLVLGAVVCWGLYSILGRRVMAHRSSISASALSVLFALPVLLILAVWELWTTPVNMTIPVALSILFIGFFPSVVSLTAWNFGVRRLGPNGAMAFYNTIPLYGVVFATAFLGESVSYIHFIGGILIVIGAMCASSR